MRHRLSAAYLLHRMQHRQNQFRVGSVQSAIQTDMLSVPWQRRVTLLESRQNVDNSMTRTIRNRSVSKLHRIDQQEDESLRSILVTGNYNILQFTANTAQFLLPLYYHTRECTKQHYRESAHHYRREEVGYCSPP